MLTVVGLVLGCVILRSLHKLFCLGEQIMANLKDLNDTLDKVAAGVDSLEASIKDLKAQVAAGGVVTQTDLDALVAKAAAIVADIADTSDQV